MPTPPADHHLERLVDSYDARDRLGLFQLHVALFALEAEADAVKAADIEAIEAFWEMSEPSFTSAGYLLRLRDGRRFHMTCVVDEDEDAIEDEGDSGFQTDIKLEPVAPDLALPDIDPDPPHGWIRETSTLNDFLHRGWRRVN